MTVLRCGLTSANINSVKRTVDADLGVKIASVYCRQTLQTSKRHFNYSQTLSQVLSLYMNMFTTSVEARS